MKALILCYGVLGTSSPHALFPCHNMCVHIHINYLHVCIYIYTYFYTYRKYTHLCMCMYMHVIYIYIYIYFFLYLCICLLYVYGYMSICMWMHTHTHTHTKHTWASTHLLSIEPSSMSAGLAFFLPFSGHLYLSTPGLWLSLVAILFALFNCLAKRAVLGKTRLSDLGPGAF